MERTDTSITMSYEEMCNLVFEAAGAATQPLMRDHPQYVFPSEEVASNVSDVIQDKTGINTNDVEGYARG